MRSFKILVIIIIIVVLGINTREIFFKEQKASKLDSAFTEYQIENVCKSKSMGKLSINELPVKCLKYYDR